ncbi:MAG: peptide chain release factor N(5)-glutamine methyltransferase [Peptoniphilus harei]|nr:peptide chain release factor N(5)-glutamine methyltransferase [Peptoniphilus harei]MDU1023259.1 peptide chain release factor N(5)-glutamine methyltransferase [Peptoniphilus harei]MDU4046243.1 peptide chain release factor N(5)-glutamine methyltransferase [Peptoniphilus harei]MDU5466459.1 peptide chain release factor N(5)-glutamine methyltransferase [Peptoniphilus harei]
MKIKEALIEGRDFLKNLEYTDPIYETRKILAEILNKDLSYLVSHDNEKLEEAIKNKYFDILKKRKEGIPLQYILGREDFYGRTFTVLEGVLIPRQDTEISVEVILKILKENNINKMLEIGCGTGIVSITVDLESKRKMDITALDISSYAINNTTINKKSLKSNIKILESDLFEKVSGKFDLIYSNPPYIKSSEIENLQLEVKDHEPRLALDGGIDGLYFYREIIKEAPNYLNNNGFLVFEIGYDEAEDISLIMEKNFDTKIYKDLNNLDRVIVGQLKI